MKPSIELKSIDKSFVGVHALKDVSLTCYPGQVHVLQGENGAGKSTLLKILVGLYIPDSGEIIINGNPVHFKHPQDAKKYGISMVFQEMSLFPELTVAQNVFLNQSHRGLFTNEKKIMQEAADLADKYSIRIDPYQKTGDLPIASQQMIEILKALATNPDIFILDEPTSSLTTKEVDKLYQIVQELKKDGKTIIFISHRIEEVFRFGDVVTVLKDGTYVDTLNLKDIDEDKIIQLMVGRELKNIFPEKNTSLTETVFSISNFSDGHFFYDINISIGKNEIVGIGALDGQGQTELFQAIAGIRHRTSGTVILNGSEISYSNIRTAMKYGIDYVPEDRKGLGLCLTMTVGENLSLSSLSRRQRLGFIDKKTEDQTNRDMIAKLNIKTPSPLQKVMMLSGGNQQKVSIGKSLENLPKVLLLNEPTRGIDVEAKQEIYILLRKLAKQGVAILVYTSDMMETIGLCDKVLTMFEGRITGEIGADELTEESIMKGAMGQNKEPAKEEVQ